MLRNHLTNISTQGQHVQIQTAYDELGDVMVDLDSALYFATGFLLHRHFHIDWWHFNTYPAVSVMHIAFLGKLSIPLAPHTPDQLTVVGH